MAKPEDLKVGDFVSWNSSGGRAKGKITKKVSNGAVPDIDATVEGTKDDPAYQIRVYRDNEPTDTLVGHKAGALTKIDPIKSDKSSDRIEEVLEKVDAQADAIEQLRSAVSEILAMHTQTISKSTEAEEREDTLDTHIGEPTLKQLQMINKLTATDSEAKDWIVVPFQASNSLVDFSIRRWHPSTALSMATSAIGRPILMDHDWGSAKNSAVGTIFDAKVIIDSEAPEEVIRGGGYEKFNREIVAEEGYQWLYLCAAISRNSEAAEKVLSRAYNDCSTGSVLSQPFMICPNCSKEHGREVSFYEQTKDAKGNSTFTCPHLIPSKWMLDMMAMYGDEGEEFNFADYCTLGGLRNELIENSLCNRGALPAASVIRHS